MPTSVVRIDQLPAVPLAVVRRHVRRGELSAAVRDGCGRAFAFAHARQLTAGRNVAIYWDGSILLESGVELDGPFDEADGIVRSATPAGLTACATLIGPYDQLGVAHAAIQEWCRAHGHRIAGPNWEVYGHWLPAWNSDPSQIRTDVYYQIATVGARQS